MFVVCNHCHRHFRDQESTCPFCGATRSSGPLKLRVGLALAMGITTTLACGGDVSDPGNEGSGGNTFETSSGGSSAVGGQSSTPKTSGAGGGGITAAYGTPPAGGRSNTTASTGPATGGRPMVAYGVPPTGARPSTSDTTATGGVATGGSSTKGLGGFGGAYAVPPTSARAGSGGVNTTTVRSSHPAYGTAPLSGGTGNVTRASSSNTMIVAPAYGVPPFGGNGN